MVYHLQIVDLKSGDTTQLDEKGLETKRVDILGQEKMDVLAQEDTKREAIPPCTVVLLRPGWTGRHPLTLLRKGLLSLSWSLISSTVMGMGIWDPRQDDVHKQVAQHLQGKAQKSGPG